MGRNLVKPTKRVRKNVIICTMPIGYNTLGVYKHKGHPITKETRLKISVANKGKKRQPFSEERRREISR